MRKLIVILGPTASGKTGLAISLAKKFKGEIVSADSRQVYRGLDIGTAKATKAMVRDVKHHLIDIKEPRQTYTLWQYKKDALQKIKELIKRGKTPFLVGGTGLYIRAVVDNLDIPQVKPDWKLRKSLEIKIKRRGLKKVYEDLIKIDPEAAYIVDPQNPRRVIRALEVAIKTKKPFSRQYKQRRPIFDILQIGLNPDREELKEKIEKRADKMLKEGLVEEVKNLIGKYDKNLPVFDAIGYREIINYLDKKISLAEALEKIKKNTWRFARRQMTWFKKDKRVNWIKTQKEAPKKSLRDLTGQAEKLIKEFL